MDSNFKSQKPKSKTLSVAVIGNELIGETSKNFMRELLNIKNTNKTFSGEIYPGENVAFREVISGERDKNLKLEHQITFERTLMQEEKVLIERKTNELRLTLEAIRQETQRLANATPKLVQELQIAAMQVSVNPKAYDVFFFERILEAIKSFRQKSENAAVWLHSANKRAGRKTFWDQYKVSGGKRLLAAEDYNGRSAG